MALIPRLDLRQTQALTITPQLTQALRLLQATNQEVAAFLAEEVQRNPLLELAEGEASAVGAEPSPTAGDASWGREGEAATLAAAPPNGRADGAAVPSAAARPEAEDLPWAAPRHTGRGLAQAEEASTLDGIAAAEAPLRERIAQQIRLSFRDPAERMLAAAMLAELDPAGRLPVPAAAFAARLNLPPALAEAVRQRLMRLDPPGLFAHDLAECLAIQLEEQGLLDAPMRILLRHLPLLAEGRMASLAALCGVDRARLAAMVAALRRCDPKPGAGGDHPPPTPAPDLLLRPGPDGGWVVELNPETLPRVLVRRGFAERALIACRGDAAARSYLQQQLQAANWLVRTLEQRARTLLQVAGAIVARQDAFLRHGAAFLRPLTLKDIAEECGLHESTVSRATSARRIATPRGVLELRAFFANALPSRGGGPAVSSAAVRQRIRALVEAEQPGAILSDDQIVALLRKEGVDIARRTVAKYRDAMRIPPLGVRRRAKEGAAASA
ncbi:MAG: RNA polymerase factor sigma-54 [Rhodovarius sp.]|nr:RNA polymerase factor sigma-54 [Rhodovarius sp.]